MLTVEGVSTGYGKKQVLFDASLVVRQGEIVLLAGSNGSGKSTFLKAIYGILPQWSNGKIFFDGEYITDKPTTILLKKGLLYIPQKNNLFEDLTVKENLEMAGLILNQRILQQRIENALSFFKVLVPHLKRKPINLSGGERQLLAFAMATLHQPKMLLIDEPFAGLSPQNVSLILNNIKMLNQKSGLTMLIVEHRIKEITSIANRVIGLKLGRIYCEIEIDENFNISQLNKVFI